MRDDDFIRQWHAQTSAATTQALAHLAAQDVSPVSDGILGEWVRAVVGVRFTDADVPYIVALIGKSDPHLQEAGIEIATAALRSTDGAHRIEVAIQELLARGEPDAWVVEALVDYLATSGSTDAAIYEALARCHLAHLDGHVRPLDVTRLAPHMLIMRNRYIDPWRRLVADVYERNAIQTIQPLRRDRAVLPVLERVNGTQGWDATVRSILLRMGIDPDEHFARLRNVGR